MTIQMREDFRWHPVSSIAEMREYYRSKLPAAREAAREHGYALCVHGSEERDFDIVAVPWVEAAVSKDELVSILHYIFSGGCVSQSYPWEEKPHGRIATSFPVLWLEYPGCLEDSVFRAGSGCVDLSILPRGDAK